MKLIVGNKDEDIRRDGAEVSAETANNLCPPPDRNKAIDLAIIEPDKSKAPVLPKERSGPYGICYFPRRMSLQFTDVPDGIG